MDIKDKLRSPAIAFYEYTVDNGALLSEAADEIESLRANLTESQRNYAKLADTYYGTPCDQIRWQQEKEELLTKLAEAEKDAGRIDYLAAKCCGASDSERYLPFRLYWGKGTHKTIREVIDEAMEEHKDETI